LEKDKPPILGLIQRGGEVVLRMLANVQQATIKPIITAAVAPGTLVHTDEYSIYARLPAWGYEHKTVCHARGEYARDEDGDGFCEVHVNTMEGFWSLLRSWLRPHRASRKANCRTISAFSSSCIMRADAARPCLVPSSPPFLDDSGQHPGTRQEPYAIALYELIQLRANMDRSVEVFPIARFRDLLGVPEGTNKRGNDFVRAVIEPAVLEVNALSDLSVAIEVRRRSIRAPIETLAVTWWRKEGDPFREAIRECQRPKAFRMNNRFGLCCVGPVRIP